MIQFNEIRITPDAERLIIDIQIKEDTYFNKVAIDNVQIFKIEDAEGTCNELLSDAPESEDSISDPSSIVSSSGRGVTKVTYRLNSANLGISTLRGALFKVVVTTKGVSTAPEGYASPIVTVLISDLYPFYIKTLANIRMLDDLSSNSNELIDCILRFKALELAFRTGNANLAIQYWFKYFDTINKEIGRSFLKVNYYD